MSFSSDVQKWARATNTSMSKTVRGVCLIAVQEVVKRTPVGETARLRGNWFATIGTPSREVSEAGDSDGGPTIARAQGAISKAPGEQFWFTNNLPYAIPIEFFGHSSVKAPEGMVRVTAENIRANMRAEVRKHEPRQ